MVDKVTQMAAELIFSVDAHISLTHSGSKPYECDQFKYSSKTAQNLKTHKLTHSGEKPCACDQCKYSSKMAQNLTHSGNKDFWIKKASADFYFLYADFHFLWARVHIIVQILKG